MNSLRGQVKVTPPQTLSLLTRSLLRKKRRAENFPVALFVLPPAFRRDLMAVYDVVRVIDELGDTAAGDRIAQLKAFAEDLDAIWTGGRPQGQLLQALQVSVRARGLSQQPFNDLIEANLLDQRVSEYETFEDLVGYCQLSAAPIGQLVLELFGCRAPATEQLSDQVCIALQVLEHLQDVGEDRRAGRVYLPQADLRRFEVPLADLAASATSDSLARLVIFETDRATELMRSGTILLGQLRGWPKLAVAGYLAGGLATADALRAAAGDVLGQQVKPGRTAIVRHLLRQLRPSKGLTT